MMTLKKHILKRIVTFTSILGIIILLFYLYAFVRIDGFVFFEFFCVMLLVIFFSIAFLLFEASELKSKKEFANRKFNLFTAFSLILVLVTTLVIFLNGAVLNF